MSYFEGVRRALLASALAGTSSVLALASAGGAAAQTIEPAAEDVSDEIVVTAQKREQSLAEVPMSITTFSGDQLQDLGITSVDALMRVTPGFSYAESGSGVPVYSLRGVGFYETTLGARPTVSVYQDEVPLPFSIMGQAAVLDLRRVEVLKGPQGTLFGQNATGGAINYIAETPTDDFTAGVNTSYTNFGEIDTTGYISGRLAPTLSGRIAARVDQGGAWQQSTSHDEELGDDDFTHLRAILDWRPSEDLLFRLSANAFRDQGDTQAAQKVGTIFNPASQATRVPLTVAYPNSPEEPRAADWGPGQNLTKDNEFSQVALRAEWDLGAVATLTSLTSYAEMSIDQLLDQDGMTLEASRTNVTGDLASFSQELRLAGRLGRADYVLGANYSRDTADERDYFWFPYTASGVGGAPVVSTRASILTGDQTFETTAVFGNVDFNFSDAFVGHAGVRYTETELDYFSCSLAGDAFSASGYQTTVNTVRGLASLPPITLAAGDCVTLDGSFNNVGLRGVLSEDNVAWRVGLDWKPADDVLFYVNVSQGYKSGSGPVLPAIQTFQLTPVVQESVLAYEVGFRAPLMRDRIEISGALFDYEYEDKQLLGRRPSLLGVLPALVNVPESRVSGAEFQLNVFPFDGLSISLGGTYLDSEVTAPFSNYTILGVAANFEGNAFPYTPELQFVTDINYRREFSNGLFGFAGVSANYRSETTAGFGDDPRLDIDAYTIVDARIGVGADDDWRLTAFVRNAGDEYYWTNVARLSDVFRRYAGQPRTWGVQLDLEF